MTSIKSKMGLKGQVLAEVIDHTGKVVKSRHWQPNLILDQGLNTLATEFLCDLFKYAVAGTGVPGGDATATKEVVPGANSFTLSGGTITRTAGTRNFTADDVGKLVRSDDNKECIIAAYTDATHVDVRQVGKLGLTNFTARDITLYSVHQTGMDAEIWRTNTYSSVSGENSTTTGTGGTADERTFKRTFIFDPEPEQKEVVTGTYGWPLSSSTITRASGARAFTTADVGKYIEFQTSGQFAKITGYTSATVVTVDRQPDTAEVAQAINVYGFRTYKEIGFSHSETAANNLNIRVRLEDNGGTVQPVLVLGENPETPGQQLKITYQLLLTASPSAVSGTVVANITDTGNVMSSNKNGKYVLESYATSQVASSGETDASYINLEPSYAGRIALSPSTTALAAFGNTDRSDGVSAVDGELDDYEEDSFTRLVVGTFSLNDAVASNWRSMGLYDGDSENFVFTFLFNANQIKDGEHSLTLRFRKSWNRDLS